MLTTLLLLSTLAVNPTPDPTPTKTPTLGMYEMCEMYKDFVKDIADVRFSAPFQEVYDSLASNPHAQKVVIEAYKLPYFKSPQARNFIIDDFVDMHYIRCIEQELRRP